MSGVKMSLGTITKKAKTFVKELWGLDFDIKIELSGRMTSTLGYVAYKTDRINHKEVPTKMKIASRLVNGDYKEETIDGVILHECCHYALMKLGKPASDGHPVFEAELKRIGASSTGTIKNAGESHTFCCSKCGKTFGGISDKKAKSLINKINDLFRYPVSKCCRARIKYMGKIYREDNNTTKQALDVKAQDVKAMMSIAKPVIIVKKNHIVVPNGPNGKVTNNTLLKVVKDLIKENNIDGVREVKSKYPEIFESSFKYLSKKEQDIIKRLAI